MPKPKIPPHVWVLVVESRDGDSRVLKVARAIRPMQPHATAAAEQLGARALGPRVWSTTRGVMLRIVKLTEAAHIRRLWNVREGQPHLEDHRC